MFLGKILNGILKDSHWPFMLYKNRTQQLPIFQRHQKRGKGSSDKRSLSGLLEAPETQCRCHLCWLHARWKDPISESSSGFWYRTWRNLTGSELKLLFLSLQIFFTTWMYSTGSFGKAVINCPFQLWTTYRWSPSNQAKCVNCYNNELTVSSW